MDYSLLVGIHNKQVQVPWHSLVKNYQHNEGEWSHLLSSGSSPDPASMPRDSANVTSRAVWLMQHNKEPTTQGQDCCIEASSIVGPYSYYFGIIDILQEWNWSKKMERYFKYLILRKDPEGLSAIEPNTYQNRFMARIGDILNLTEEGSGPDHDDLRLEPAAIINRTRGADSLPPHLEPHRGVEAITDSVIQGQRITRDELSELRMSFGNSLAGTGSEGTGARYSRANTGRDSQDAFSLPGSAINDF